MNDFKLIAILAMEKLISGETKKHIFLAWHTNEDNIDNVITNCVKSNFSRLNFETLNYVDYKLANDEYIIVSHYPIDKPEGLNIIKSESSYYAYKQQAAAAFIKELEKNISDYLSQFLPGMKYFDSKIPQYIYISYNSEYDDNNYYTDIEGVSFYSTNGSSYDSDCEFITDWDDCCSINVAIREYIRENYTVSEVELYIGNNGLNLNLSHPSEQEMKKITDIINEYNSNPDKYNSPSYEYDESISKYVFTLEENGD